MQVWVIFLYHALLGEEKRQILTNTSKNITICHDFYNNAKRTITIAKLLIKAVAELMDLIFMQIQLRTWSETWNGIWRGRASGSWLTGASICPAQCRMSQPSLYTAHVIGADVHQLPQNEVSHLRIEKWSCFWLIMKLLFVLQIFNSPLGHWNIKTILPIKSHMHIHTGNMFEGMDV